MQQFMAAKFEPAACAALLRDAIARYPFLEELFDPDSVAAGGCIASRALLYDLHQQRDRWTLALAPRHGEPIVLDTAAGDVPQLANALRDALQRNHWQPLSALYADPRLLGCERPAGDAALAWPAFDGPGIQRLEHASLLIASDTTRLLTDPISLAIGGNVGLPDLDRAPSNLGQRIDGMLVTHGHLDHWHVPTILRHGGDGSVPSSCRASRSHRCWRRTTCSSRCVTSGRRCSRPAGARRCGSATSRSTSCRSTASSRPSARPCRRTTCATGAIATGSRRRSSR